MAALTTNGAASPPGALSDRTEGLGDEIRDYDAGDGAGRHLPSRPDQTQQSSS
jgi:hypothetical protein